MNTGKNSPFAGQGDTLYAALIEAHAGLPPEASAALDARLVLLLLAEIDDPARGAALIAAAGAAGEEEAGA